MSIQQRLTLMTVLCCLMIGTAASGVQAQTSDRDSSACLTQTEVRSLLAAHPLIEFDAAGTMPCTDAELLALVAILEAIHDNFPREISTVAEADDSSAVGGAAGSSGGRRTFACTGHVIPSVLHIRHRIRASESRGELRPEAASQSARAVNFGDVHATLAFIAAALPQITPPLAALLLTHGTATALTHSRNVRTDGFEVGPWHGGANAIKLKARYDLRIGIESYDLTIPINNLKNDCTRWPFA